MTAQALWGLLFVHRLALGLFARLKPASLFRANLHAFCRAAGKHPTRGAKVPHIIEV